MNTEHLDDGALTDLARRLFAAWGTGAGRSTVPRDDTQRLRRFADALGADGLVRVAAEDAAMRRLEAMLRISSPGDGGTSSRL
jgi:hypothetical protein